MFDWASLRLTWEPRMLSILRIMVGLLYWQHGLNKLFNFPPTANHAAYNLFTLAPGLAGILEIVGGVLLAFGLFTRPVAFILRRDGGGLFHGQRTERVLSTGNGGELAVIYCFVFLYFFVAGGGIWSLDRLWIGRASGSVAAE